jgi:TonB-linked outer membrane protein, SusC/RagA family
MKNQKTIFKTIMSFSLQRLSMTMLLIIFSGLCSFVTAQDVKFTGTVKDNQGLPLPGASVVVKGTKKGSITDYNGHFEIKAPSNAQVQVSFLGYEAQVVTLKAGAPVTVTLEEIQNSINEVVVTGYGGAQKIKNSTFAAQNINIKEVEDQATTNLATMLRDQVPGLNVTGGESRPGVFADVSIRQTFNYSKDGGNAVPLIIIDDVPQVDYNTGLATLGALNSLDISEVESITVLKDAAAAIYGSRASQGAIIIKTKRGKKGEPQISYTGKFTLEDAVSHSKTLDTYQYGVFANSFLRAKGVTNSNYLFSDDELAQMKNLNYNWLKDAWHSAGLYQHSLNITGGTDKMTYYTGGSYSNDGANMGFIDYKRWNFRSGGTANLGKGIKLDVALSANKSDKADTFSKVLGTLADGSYGAAASGQPDYAYMLHMPGYIPYQYNINGVDYFISPSIGPDRNTSTPNTNRVIAAWNYYATNQNNSKSINNSGSYNANFSLNYDVPFIKGLSFKASYALSYGSSQNEQIQDVYTLARSLNSNAAGTHLYGPNTNWVIAQVNQNSRVSYGDNDNKSTQANAYVNYYGKFGKHEITAMASVERAESSAREALQLYTSPVTPYSGTNATAGTMDVTNSYVYRYESGTMAYIGRLTYAYADKYLFNFVIRSDASTKFAPEHYWGTFPSTSFGWVPSEEKWFKENIQWMDFLKIRCSLGLTGKDNLKGWKWLQTYGWDGNKGYQFGSTGGIFSNANKANAAPNRNATWDKDFKQDIGIDATFLKSRLSVTYDYYFDKYYDMLISRASEVGTPISAGGSVAEENFAAINAWGHELSVRWRDKIGKFTYGIGVNTSFGIGNIVKKYIKTGVNYPAANVIREGYSTIYPSWGYKVWKGTSKGDGILRTTEDINKYWSYLSANALAAGTTPKYFSVTDPSALKKGMVAYQDLGGDLNADGTQKGPNGQIVDVQDYGKLASGQNYGFSTNLNIARGQFSLSATINTSWGGLNMIDRVGANTSSNNMLWNRETFWTGMYDEGVVTTDAKGRSYLKYSNLDGKYPQLGVDNTLLNSDFWQVSSFRSYVRTLTAAYTLPNRICNMLGLASMRFNLTGTNLWDLYNPYPQKYRNMYDDSTVGYPTLRAWTLGVNIGLK